VPGVSGSEQFGVRDDILKLLEVKLSKPIISLACVAILGTASTSLTRGPTERALEKKKDLHLNG
jgi:hypothetical protein